jgi:hypothetical protein
MNIIKIESGPHVERRCVDCGRTRHPTVCEPCVKAERLARPMTGLEAFVYVSVFVLFLVGMGMIMRFVTQN